VELGVQPIELPEDQAGLLKFLPPQTTTFI
jgi:hypothetical protein